MKTIILLGAIAGLAVGWGFYGQKQVRTGLYDCEVRLDSLCFSWKKNDEGDKRDGVNQHLQRNLQ